MTPGLPSSSPPSIHGTCISLAGLGLLLLGPPGSGKSDLALRLIDQPGFGLGLEPDAPAKATMLVADDQVVITPEGDHLYASPPERLAGFLEVRGLGLMQIPHLARVRLAAVFRLVPHAEIERLPCLASRRETLSGIALPLFEIDPHMASAPARVRAAADWIFKA